MKTYKLRYHLEILILETLSESILDSVKITERSVRIYALNLQHVICTGNDRIWIDLDIGDEVFSTDAFSGITVDVNTGPSNVYYKPGSNEIIAESAKYGRVVCIF